MDKGFIQMRIRNYYMNWQQSCTVQLYEYLDKYKKDFILIRMDFL